MTSNVLGIPPREDDHFSCGYFCTSLSYLDWSVPVLLGDEVGNLANICHSVFRVPVCFEGPVFILLNKCLKLIETNT